MFFCTCLKLLAPLVSFFFFFFNDTATTEIYTLSLHDALPIWPLSCLRYRRPQFFATGGLRRLGLRRNCAERVEFSSIDRKSTRLNSSHVRISYAVFCLKKKKKKLQQHAAMVYTITS